MMHKHTLDPPMMYFVTEKSNGYVRLFVKVSDFVSLENLVILDHSCTILLPLSPQVYRAIALLLSRLTTVNFDVINGFGQNPMQIEFVN